MTRKQIEQIVAAVVAAISGKKEAPEAKAPEAKAPETQVRKPGKVVRARKDVNPEKILLAYCRAAWSGKVNPRFRGLALNDRALKDAWRELGFSVWSPEDTGNQNDLDRAADALAVKGLAHKAGSKRGPILWPPRQPETAETGKSPKKPKPVNRFKAILEAEE